MEILAIDLGSVNSVYCVLDTRLGDIRFGHVGSVQEELRELLKQERPDRVVAEICPLAAMVYDVARVAGIDVQIADTTQDAWQWRTVKRKTDRDDAMKLARLSALGQINCVHIPAPAIRQWRKLIEQRSTLVAERTRCKNRIRSLLVAEDFVLPRGKCGWSQGTVDLLQEAARPLAECTTDELWRGILHVELQRLEALARLLEEVEAQLDGLAKADRRMELVSTVPGVGRRVAEVIVAVLDDAKRFRSPRQVAAYAGLTPRRYQSGQMDRQGRISKRGNPLLRQVLNQAAWVAVRYDPHFRDVFQRISGGRQGRRKPAIVAVMRRLLVVAWAVLRDERPYELRPVSRDVAAA
jgi:transposase